MVYSLELVTVCSPNPSLSMTSVFTLLQWRLPRTWSALSHRQHHPKRALWSQFDSREPRRMQPTAMFSRDKWVWQAELRCCQAIWNCLLWDLFYIMFKGIIIMSFRAWSLEVAQTLSLWFDWPTIVSTQNNISCIIYLLPFFSSLADLSLFPFADPACSDQYHNCMVVVQARLCVYPYYRGVCCASCSRAQQSYPHSFQKHHIRRWCCNPV